MTLSEIGEKELKHYLMYHEQDIAYGINDFDELRGLFVEVFKRQPRMER